MTKTRPPQELNDALDQVLRYQQYRAIASFIVWGLLYLAAKNRQRQTAGS